ncbi:uncharacterized protein MYCFIDRAFT_176064 [Pseudocercospora fijiensis CIRAD86]|uniref:Uncharacterized protein n=1 Tax=Pseudocercospora fijiensis (strain CIRAD86) TaxID=383855 RepID=M2ZU35_PSEFD|nr:uncharacterized protein MYCFIDRAFT_176064 [Pseudocercospora fijiensis CIRAD86]EME82519.1 hypothetical protein MYCFIDRAFT_176064 [Pseudocercospora fijiensis CIRAD86]
MHEKRIRVLSLPLSIPRSKSSKIPQTVRLKPERMDAFRYVIMLGNQRVEQIEAFLVVMQDEFPDEMAVGSPSKAPTHETEVLDGSGVTSLTNPVEELVRQTRETGHGSKLGIYCASTSQLRAPCGRKYEKSCWKRGAVKTFHNKSGTFRLRLTRYREEEQYLLLNEQPFKSPRPNERTISIPQESAICYLQNFRLVIQQRELLLLQPSPHPWIPLRPSSVGSYADSSMQRGPNQ